MKMTPTKARVAASMSAVLSAVRESVAITSVDLERKTNLTSKIVRSRLKEAKENGDLIYVRASGLTLWCEPANSERVYRESRPKTARGNKFQQPHTARELQIIKALSDRPLGVRVRDLCAEFKVCKTSIKNRMYGLRERGLVSGYPCTGSVHAVWFLTQHREAAVAAYEASRHDVNDSRRKRKNAASRVQKPVCDETPEPGDFFQARIIPARLAPPMVIRGPVSVFQLGAM